MAVEIFKTEDGMLTIEKHDAQSVSPRMMRMQAPTGQSLLLNTNNMIETVFSYSDVCDKSKTGKCDICGVQTEFANRHVCQYCWSKHNMKIMYALKSLEPKEIEIGL